ncbi:hypothetical protein [Streptomyces sp. NBC_01217]|uniref:hypothetical protein n=1 Tax=Streptomyces sp. NBC_01217 TaxID=2903779 RepID=UPI002E0F36EE|nr:hypothetical protein OG507_38645 [Streptomyces sp. NBC_01217]
MRAVGLYEFFGAVRDGGTFVRELAEAGVLIPRVAQTHSPVEAADAHRRFAAGGVHGRLVITF